MSADVTTTFTYNGRRLPVRIQYLVPAGLSNPGSTGFVPPTPDTVFEYDDAGNRQKMTDGSGITTYSYDALSRLASEKKVFNGLTGEYPLTYGYTLAGALKTITEPFDGSVTYQRDSVDRVNKVTGTGYGHRTDTLAEEITYRGFGAVDKVKSGTGHEITYSYDGSRRLSQAALTDPLGRMGKDASRSDSYVTDYGYNADAAVSKADETFYQAPANAYGIGEIKRPYAYDALGRLTAANAFATTQTFRYSAFGHVKCPRR